MTMLPLTPAIVAPKRTVASFLGDAYGSRNRTAVLVVVLTTKHQGAESLVMVAGVLFWNMEDDSSLSQWILC